MLHVKPRTPVRKRVVAASVGALFILMGCATAPSPPQTSLVVPEQWSTTAVTSRAAPGQVDAWWRHFGSAELDALIESALKANLDLRIAAARLSQARALANGAQAERLPEVALMAGAQRGRETGIDPKANRVSGGFRASWELDVFSSKALASTAAALDAQSAELALQAARVALAAEVATTYFDIQALSRRESVAREAFATLDRQIEVARRRFEAGQLGSLDIDRFTSELRQEQANAAQLQGALKVRQTQLGVLLGTAQVVTAPSWVDWDSDSLGAPAAPVPAELLERRPDVLRYARALEAEAARVGVAKRDLYPRIQFDWIGSKERLSFKGTDAATTVVVGYGVSLSLPIFDGGRIRANIAVHEARVQEAMAEYEKAMLGALSDAEIAFAQLSTAQSSVTELEQALNAGTEASRKSERLFEAGLTDLNTVLDVRRNQLRVQDALLQARAARWAAAVAIRRAFAGEV